MFWTIYRGRIKSSLRDRDILIWTLLFPLMLATLFFFAFSSLDSANQFEPIPAAVVENEALAGEQTFAAVLDQVSESGEDQLLSLRRVADTDQAEALLDAGEIDGYILPGSTSILVVKTDGLGQTILKSFLDQYVQTEASIQTLLSENPAALENLDLTHSASYTQEIALTSARQTDTVNYFYALLAMICMYGGFQGLTSVSHLQANLSPLGARRTMAPEGRFQLVLADLLGGITVHFGVMAILLLYLLLALKISFGPHLPLVFLPCAVGTLLGVSFGALVSIPAKLKESAKTAIQISVTLVCSFLAGLMVGGVNYVVASKAPVVAWLNPAARIADAFYCLYYYDSLDRYFLNIAILLGMSAIFLLTTVFFVRRQRYESI